MSDSDQLPVTPSFQVMPLAAAPPYAEFTRNRNSESIPASHYLRIVRRRFWFIAPFVIVVTLPTFLLTRQLPRMYESTARVDVDRRAPAGVIGQEAVQTPGLNDSDQFLATQIEIIKSDAVLRPVAKQFDLLRVEKQTRTSSDEDAQLANAPIVLRNLNVARSPNSFILRISYRDHDRVLAAAVANAIAHSYIEHAYDLRVQSSQLLSAFMEKQIGELKAKMERSSQALAAFERELNVVNPEERTSILASRLLQINTEYTSAQADRVRKEAAYNSLKSGSTAAERVSSQGEALSKLQDRLQIAQEHFAQTKTIYGPNHAEYKKAANDLAELHRQFEETRRDILPRIESEYRQALDRENLLQQAVAVAKEESDKLNLRSLEFSQVKHEAETDRQLYDELIRRIREASINAGFQNSAIRIADDARPSAQPVAPNVKLFTLLAFLTSICVSVGFFVVRDLTDGTLRDPEQARRILSTDVIGLLPNRTDTKNNSSALSIRSLTDGNSALIGVDFYGESVRTLLAGILMPRANKRVRSLLVTSAAPREGKSTTALHLALANAQERKRTLLIDADLRRPSLRELLPLVAAGRQRRGLADVIEGQVTWAEAIVPVPGQPNLFFLDSGEASPLSANLVGSSLRGFLRQACQVYDLVIVDAPPLLGFAEPFQIASFADGVLLVVNAGGTSGDAAGAALDLLNRLPANTVGVALNRYRPQHSSRYDLEEGYRKYYSSPSGKTV